LTDARVARARKVLRLTPSIAVNRRKEHFKRANVVIKDVQKQWKQTFEPPKKKQVAPARPKLPSQPLSGEAVQGDLFGQW